MPGIIRRRIQAAMPVLPPSRHPCISCQPPQLSLAALSPLQSGTSTSGPQQKGNSTSWVPTNVSIRNKAAFATQDPEMEVDPWTLLEDGTSCPSMSSGSNSSSGMAGDHGNLKACSWLKGAVRVRRTELTYIGSLDDDSWSCLYAITADVAQIQDGDWGNFFGFGPGWAWVVYMPPPW